MAYSVHFAVDLKAVAASARLQIEEVMRQIGEVVSGIPPANAFWGSMGDSTLKIDVAGFRVVYCIEPRVREIFVVAIEKAVRC